jgi:heme exporter protein A
LFESLNFEVQAGEAHRIAGDNGCGKTSLLRLLCGLALPTQGTVRWNGCDIRNEREDFNRQLIYIGHASGVKEDLLAWENVLFAATLSGQKVSREQVYDVLDLLGLGRAADLPTRSLSQGQRKRVALARLWLGMQTPLWILDEPFAALDPEAVLQLCRLLDQHLAQGGMLIYTTHQEINLLTQAHLHLSLNPVTAC